MARRTWLKTLGAAGALAAGWPPLAPSAAAAQPAAARIGLPRLAWARRQLANGLTVISQPGGGGGMVTIQVWYRVGGKDDPEGRSGFAHLFEHLMFKGSRHLQAEQFDRLTEDVGGQNNAFTAEDVTAYQALVPAHHLERILWAEAERMAHLTVDDANFRSERAVVQEEYRERVLAQPYGRLFEAVATEAFSVHPYRRPVIGSIADLDAASLADVRAFHTTYYRPDNAVLIVAGDFDTAQLNAWVDRYFGPLSRPAAAIPRVNVTEPPRQAPREVVLTAPNVPLPAVMRLWQGPPARSPDAAALGMARALLAAGDSSRLNEALVHRQHIAQSAGFDVSLYTDAGVISSFVIAAGQRQPHTLVKPLQHEIERLAIGPIGEAELAKVKNQLLTDTLKAWQTPWGRAESLGWALVTHDDPDEVNRELAALQAVNAAQVQQVLRRYVVGQPAVTLSYQQGPAPEARP